MKLIESIYLQFSLIAYTPLFLAIFLICAALTPNTINY